jgi:hypothetical protein
MIYELVDDEDASKVLRVVESEVDARYQSDNAMLRLQIMNSILLSRILVILTKNCYLLEEIRDKITMIATEQVEDE